MRADKNEARELLPKFEGSELRLRQQAEDFVNSLVKKYNPITAKEGGKLLAVATDLLRESLREFGYEALFVLSKRNAEMDEVLLFLRRSGSSRAWLSAQAGVIILPPNSTGTTIDTVTLGGKDRELIVLSGDGAVAEVVGVIDSDPPETEFGLVTRPIQRVDGETLTTTPLGISGTFNGAWNEADLDGVSFVEATARADEVSASNGFRIEESDDSGDSNFTRTVAQKTVSADTTTRLVAAITAKFWRVVYVNGGTAQGSFKLVASARQFSAPAMDGDGQLQIAVVSAPANQSVDINQIVGSAPSVSNTLPVRISDGTAFIPFPTALVGGRLSVDVGASVAIDITDRAARDLGGVDIVAALPIGANRIGKVTIRDAADAADIDPLAESTFTTRINTQGQKAMAASTPVVIASDQSAILVDGSGVTQPISAASLPLPAGAATSALQLPDGHNVTVDNATITVDAPVATPVAVRLSDGTTFYDGTKTGQLPAALVGGRLDIVVGAVTSGVTIEVVGDVAAGVAAAGNPVLIAARANLNEPTAVADAQSTYLWADQLGRLVVLDGHSNPEPPDSGEITSSGDTTLIAAPGASLSLHIQKGSVHNAGAAAVTVALKDGTAGTIRWQAEIAPDGGGSVFDFGARGWKLTANTLLAGNLSAAGNVHVNVTQYYIAA